MDDDDDDDDFRTTTETERERERRGEKRVRVFFRDAGGQKGSAIERVISIIFFRFGKRERNQIRNTNDATEEEEEERDEWKNRSARRGPRRRGNCERETGVHENLPVGVEQQNSLVYFTFNRGGYSNEKQTVVQIRRERYREEGEHEEIETHGGLPRSVRTD